MKKFLLIGLVLLFMPLVSAESYLVNSVDWRDIYSGIIYGRLNDKFVNYMPSDRAGDYIISPHLRSDEVIVLSSEKLPFVFNYLDTLRIKGLDNVEENTYSDFNLELLQELNSSFNKFIVIDDAYGYNAVSVAPYAVLAGYYVLFVDNENLNAYVNALDDRDVEDMIIYGIVDRQVRNAFETYDPTIINDFGDRFRNNIEITKMFREEYYNQNGQEAKQVILTNGEFLEDEILSGTQPVLFIGRMNVPTVTREYIQSSTISVGVLIGNELIETAQFVKDVIGISTFVKFGRSARNPTGLINEVEDLDRYPVPKVTIGLEFVDIKYNSLTSQAMVTLRNTGPIAVYLRGSYTLQTPDNNAENIRRFGDNEPEFLESGESKTFVYDIDRLFDVDTLLFDGFVLFGESRYSLELRLEHDEEIDVIEYQDDTAIEILDLVFYKNKGEFVATVKNIGTQKVFFNLEILDVIIIDIPQSFGAGKIFELEPGQQLEVSIPVPMTKDDFEQNPQIRVRSYYGKESGALINRWEGSFDLMVSSAINIVEYIPTVIIIILIILILLESTKKKCDNCKTRNKRKATTCKKCSSSLK